MKKLVNLVAGGVAAALLCVASVSPSHAVTTAFVSGAGSDANPCTLTQPCRSIGHAMGFVAGNGGVVTCLDAGPYTEFGHTGNPSFTVDCRGVVYAGSASDYAFALSYTNDGTHQVVTFRNITFDGAGGGGGGGVWSGGGARVVFENCTFQNFNVAPGIALLFQPINTQFGPQDGQLIVRDSVFVNNGLSQSGGGIIVQPTGTSSAHVVIERTTVGNNTYGIFANGSGTTGHISLQIKDSVVTSNHVHGISAYTPGGGITSIVVDRSSSVLNGVAGILAQGPGAFVTLTDSTVMSNGTGLSKIGGGSLYSYSNNRLTGNVSDGATPTTGVFTLK